MNVKNIDSKPTNDLEVFKEQVSACGPGCECGGKGSSGKMRWIVGVVVLVAAGLLVARAVVKNKDISTAKAPDSFATLADSKPVTVPDGAASSTKAVAIKEIGSLSELNTMAKDMAGVFVFLPDATNSSAQVPAAQLFGAAKTIEPQAGGQIGVFSLKPGTANYNQLATQMTMPGVLAMVKGRGIAPVSGELTETKLVQAFVTAGSSGGGCGPSSGGCGPSGCN